ncbi:auxin efflux carrier [Phellopilus nigrolimitatus]|nr:auxin efflux carrier [Phellopilus nigrolimitatus]
MLSVGALIWVSIRPLLRLVICTAGGFIITKADIFPLVAARGAGQIMLNITYPSLMFSKIVPAFTSENISALGPLVLVGVTYELLGILLAWIIKQFFWVPHRFRYGILVAGGWGNVGDVPTAVIMSITGAAPFNPSTDQTLSVAYVAAFILVFFVSLFPMGGHRLIALDFVGPEVDDSELRMSMIAKTKESFRNWTKGATLIRHVVPNPLKRSASDEKSSQRDIENEPKKTEFTETTIGEATDAQEKCAHLSQRHVRPGPSKHVSFYAHTDDAATAVPTEPFASRVCSPAHTEHVPSCITSPVASVTRFDGDETPKSPGPAHPTSVGPSTTVPPRSRALQHRMLAHARTALASLLTPQAIAIFVAFPIALITPLKALFTPVPHSPIPNAPDGQPPLAFILDTANFIGAASVPLGLTCLGSALARLNVPRDQWKDLPIGAITWLAIGKMIIMPVLGVLITQGLVHGGVIGEDQKVLRFVCMFISCIPTATTQVFLTQVYSGTGSAETLSAFLIPQYALMFVTMTILSAYSLALLF